LGLTSLGQWCEARKEQSPKCSQYFFTEKKTCSKGKLITGGGGGSSDDPSQKIRHNALREGQGLTVVFMNMYPRSIGLGVADVVLLT